MLQTSIPHPKCPSSRCTHLVETTADSENVLVQIKCWSTKQLPGLLNIVELSLKGSTHHSAKANLSVWQRNKELHKVSKEMANRPTLQTLAFIHSMWDVLGVPQRVPSNTQSRSQSALGWVLRAEIRIAFIFCAQCETTRASGRLPSHH